MIQPVPGNKLTCQINGKSLELDVPPFRRVIDLLRGDLEMTGTKISCGIGRCGACMILLDGQPVNACLLMAYQLEGRRIVTIEGLAGEAGACTGEGLHPVQQAFMEEGGFQCGYCTPGMIIALAGLLESNPNPTLDELTEGLSGNLCRCTGYGGIIRAAESAVKLGSKAAAGRGDAAAHSFERCETRQVKMMTVSELNVMDQSAFIETLGTVFEHSPWVAERAWHSRPFAGKEQLHLAMLAIVEEAHEDEKLALIRAHPDLGGKLKMTKLSVAEQRSAGLSELSADEYAEFRALNKAYTDKFGFPFIIAVKGKTKETILEAMKYRLSLEPEAEKLQALKQIADITRFRINDIIVTEATR